MLFFTMNNTDINFQIWKLQQKFYPIYNVFWTTKQVESIEKIDFIVVF